MQSSSWFRHSPLDLTKPSIRLIRILAESSDGLVQCTIADATTSDTYTCLSYEWGPEEPSRLIEINGQSFRVRLNLWNFLDEARRRRHSAAFWIDAICIDQQTMVERNHQVQQMGKIYSQAELVITWLGFSDNEEHQTPLPREENSATQKPFTKQLFSKNYWNRAWITQEVVLAKRLDVWIDQVEFDFESMIKWPELRLSPFTDYTREKDTTYLQGMSRYATLSTWRMGGLEPKQNPKLHRLLNTLSDMQCSVPRDRIYSLLSLCEEDVQADYGITETQVLQSVLDSCGISMCLCSIAFIARILCMQAQSEDMEAGCVPYFEFDASVSDYERRPGGDTTRLSIQHVCDEVSGLKWRNSSDPNAMIPPLGLWIFADDRQNRYIGRHGEGIRISHKVTEEGRDVIAVQIAFWLVGSLFPDTRQLTCKFASRRYPRPHQDYTHPPRTVFGE